MKEILDRHAERLTAEERRAMWRKISGSRARDSRSRLRWALSTAAAVLAAGVITLVTLHREPAAPPLPGPALLRESAPSAQLASPGAPLPAPATKPNRSPKPAGSIARGRPAEIGVPESIAQLAVVPESEEHPAFKPPPWAPPASAQAPAATGRVTGTLVERGKTPIEFANVIILGTKLGTMTDANGNFAIANVPAGSVEVQCQPLGFDKQVLTIQVYAGATTAVSFNFSEPKVVAQIEEVEVRTAKRIDSRSSESVQRITSSGGAASAPTPSPAPPPVVPTTGGTTLPNDEVYDSMFFRNYGVNPFIATDEDSLSTFAVDVDAASYTVTRRYIELGHLPPADAVRVEEFVNFFPQGYPRFENEDFRILVDGASSPFGRGYHLLRIGLKGRQIEARDRKPAQLTFVIDVSGSMNREDRLELVKQALRLLVDRLRDDDRVGIVVFGTEARVLLEPIALGESVGVAGGARMHSDAPAENEARDRRTGRRSLLEAIDLLHAEGSTNTEQGLVLGYEMARRGYRPEANNRIVLCSDGVANVGRTGPESILERVRTEADRGIQLSTIGFGMGNYNDVLMEQLADKGDGNYYYVDVLDEARRVFVENLTGTLQTIAKDAKIQVEFEPSRVLRYRLLGFENRDVADRDFRNDRVDAGEIGAGHEVTALYEVKLARQAARGAVATVRLRYARPEHHADGTPEVREIAADFGSSDLSRRFEDASPRFRLDAAVAEFAEILRGSYWAREGRLADVLPVARSAARSLQEDAAAEFVAMVEKATRLSRTLKPEERGQER